MLKFVLVSFAVTFLVLGSAVAAEQHEGGVFTGIYSKEGVNGRPNIVRITDGKAVQDITEQEYRERGYIPTFESLPMRIVRRIPVHPPGPNEDAK